MLKSKSGEPSSLIEAKNFAAAQAHERVTTRQAVEHVHTSPYYFSTIFKTATSMTFTEYVARMRVENAKKLLQNPRFRITDVSDEAGFNSISQFDRLFRRHAGSFPTAHRLPGFVARLGATAKSAHEKPIGA